MYIFALQPREKYILLISIIAIRDFVFLNSPQ